MKPLSANPYASQAEILAEFRGDEAILAGQLLGLRQAPGTALEARLGSLATATGTRAATERRPWRRGRATRVLGGLRTFAWTAILILMTFALGWLLYRAVPMSTLGIVHQADRDLLVIGEERGYSPGCGPREVATLVLTFFDAYNAGDQARLAALFPSTFGTATFEGYTDSLTGLTRGLPNFDFGTSRREVLLAYLAERHEQRDRLELLAIAVLPGADFGLVYRRHADDLQPGPDGSGRLGTGRGMAHCGRNELSVWGSGTAGPGEAPEAYFQSIVWCTLGYSLQNLPEAVLVCARSPSP